MFPVEISLQGSFSTTKCCLISNSSTTPTSHPFIERLIGTTRREFLDHVLFTNERDLHHKLVEFQRFYNAKRAYSALDKTTPIKKAGEKTLDVISINNYRWKKVVRGLFDLPLAA